MLVTGPRKKSTRTGPLVPAAPEWMCDSVTLLMFATTTMKVTVVPSKVMRETPLAPLARGGTSLSGESVASKSVTSSSELQLMPAGPAGAAEENGEESGSTHACLLVGAPHLNVSEDPSPGATCCRAVRGRGSCRSARW